MPRTNPRALARQLRDHLLAPLESSRRWSPQTKASQLALRSQWRVSIAAGVPPPLAETGFRVFSQVDEDGLLLYVLTALGERSRTFVDIGAGDGINSNCANLVVNHGWHGLFLDGDPDKVASGRSFYANHPDTQLGPPAFVNAMIDRDNVNDVITAAGFTGEIDLLSIDIDGNDHWVWQALTAVRPRVVIVEAHVEWGDRNLVMPYDPTHVHGGSQDEYFGMSLPAAVSLGQQLGYRLVGANVHGFNAIFVAESEAAGHLLPTVEARQVLDNWRTHARADRIEWVRGRPLVVGGTGFPGTPATID